METTAIIRQLFGQHLARYTVMATLLGLATALVNPFLALFLSHELGAGPTRIALFLFLTSVSALAVGTILAWLSDVRLTRRGLLIAGAAASCCSYASFAVIRDFWFLLAVSATLAAVGSTLIPQLFAQARQIVAREGNGDAALMISSLRTLFSVGWVLGPPLAALLVDDAGFTGLFVVVAAFYGLMAVFAARTETAPRRPGAQRQGRDSVVFRPDVVIATVAFVALQTASTLGVLALPLLVTHELGAGVGTVGFAVGLAAALEIPLMPVLGSLARRVSPRMLVCTGAVSGVTYFGTVAAAGGVWQVIAAQALSALFVAGIMGIGISYFQEMMPDKVGSATTLYSNTTKISSMVAGPLIGLAQATGYRAIFVVSATLCAIGLALLLVPVHSKAAAGI